MLSGPFLRPKKQKTHQFQLQKKYIEKRKSLPINDITKPTRKIYPICSKSSLSFFHFVGGLYEEEEK